MAKGNLDKYDNEIKETQHRMPIYQAIAKHQKAIQTTMPRLVTSSCLVITTPELHDIKTIEQCGVTKVILCNPKRGWQWKARAKLGRNLNRYGLIAKKCQNATKHCYRGNLTAANLDFDKSLGKSLLGDLIETGNSTAWNVQNKAYTAQPGALIYITFVAAREPKPVSDIIDQLYESQYGHKYLGIKATPEQKLDRQIIRARLVIEAFMVHQPWHYQTVGFHTYRAGRNPMCYVGFKLVQDPTAESVLRDPYKQAVLDIMATKRYFKAKV